MPGAARRVEYHTAPMETVSAKNARDTRTRLPAGRPILVAVTYTHHRWGTGGVAVMKNFEWVLWLGEHVGFWSNPNSTDAVRIQLKAQMF